MHVLVIGGGIIGVITAYMLRQRGCEVTLAERNDGVAQETSFANAGVLAPGIVAPLAAPGVPGSLLRSLLSAQSPLIFRPHLGPAFWRWAMQWLGQCNAQRYRINRLRMQRVALHSRDVMHTLRSTLGLHYEQSTGYLQLFRTAHALAQSSTVQAFLRETGVQFSVLDAAAVRLLEPSLSPHMPFAGALHLPNDEAGNCALFARMLRKQAETDGVQFLFGHHVHGILAYPDAVQVHTNHGLHTADAVVVAAGCASASLLRPLGLEIPIWPVKGYSATATIVAGEAAPRHALIDEVSQVAITRLGMRLRIAGISEVGNYTLDLRAQALRTLIDVARAWLPHAAQYAQASYWCGARPMLPDGAPLLGATPLPRVFLNTGHGSAGWAMACGSADVLADVVTGKQPAIDLNGLTLARYA
jgi:D-amino-acid dehydrogenase